MLIDFLSKHIKET